MMPDPSKSVSSDSDSSPDKLPRNTKIVSGRPGLRSRDNNTITALKMDEARDMIHRAPGSPRREYIPESYSPLSSVNHNQFTYSSGEEEEGDIEPRAQTPVVPITPHATVPQPPSPRSSNKKLYLGLALLALIVAVVVIPKGSKAPARPLSHTFRANCSELMDLNKKFPNQDKKLFKSLRYGVEATVNHKPPELTVFSIFSTDESLIEKLMASVIKITKECISQPQDPLDLTVDYLSEKMITDYEHELKQRSIMIIRDVGDANPETVAALHSICDTENPLVAESIIFFTLKVPKAPAGKPVDYIFDYLNERWSGLAEHIRAPLITRMLDQTFFLKP